MAFKRGVYQYLAGVEDAEYGLGIVFANWYSFAENVLSSGADQNAGK